MAGKYNVLKLVGTGNSDCYGASLANFELYKAFNNDGYPGFVANPNDLPITYLPNNIFSTINNFLSNGDFEGSKVNKGFFITTTQIPSW